MKTDHVLEAVETLKEELEIKENLIEIQQGYIESLSRSNTIMDSTIKSMRDSFLDMKSTAKRDNKFLCTALIILLTADVIGIIGLVVESIGTTL
jgi:hypothetical protein